MAETIKQYAIGLRKARELLESELFRLGYGFSTEQSYKEYEIHNKRNTFVYQLIENALMFISEIREDNADEIRILSEDIRVLIIWEKSTGSQVLYTPCNYDELLEYFNARRFEKGNLKCKYCGENYIAYIFLRMKWSSTRTASLYRD